jgi:hypothetical protein
MVRRLGPISTCILRLSFHYLGAVVETHGNDSDFVARESSPRMIKKYVIQAGVSAPRMEFCGS